MSKYLDVSADTDSKLMGNRTLERRGIVLHETIGYDSLSYLQGGSLKDGRRASADYLIGRTGLIYQLIPPGHYSYHSGVARDGLYQERDHSINQGYIGIELENFPEHGQVITTLQYIACGFLVRRLIQYWTLDIRNVRGHYQVALPSGRKTDPLTLNWGMLSQEILLPSSESFLYIPPREMP